MDILDIWVTTLTFLGHVTSPVTWPFDSPDAISLYRCSIVTESLSPTIFEIMGIFHIWVMTLTFLGHVTSSVTWPFDSPGAISYRCSIVTESLSPTIFEIMGIFHIWVTTLTFLGHVTSTVTWPIDPPYVISYWSPIVTKPLSPTLFEMMGIFHIWVMTLTFLGHVTSSVTLPFDSPGAISYRCSIVTESISNHFRDNGNFSYLGHDLDLSGSRDVIGHVTDRSAICHFLLVPHCNQTSISNRFRDIGPPNSVRTHRHNNTHTRTLNACRKQESCDAARKPRDAAAVVSSLTFANDIRYKFKSSQTSKARFR